MKTILSVSPVKINRITSVEKFSFKIYVNSMAVGITHICKGLAALTYTSKYVDFNCIIIIN